MERIKDLISEGRFEEAKRAIDKSKLSNEEKRSLYILLKEEIQNKNRYYTEDTLKMYLKEMSKYPMISKEESFRLARKMRNGDEEARKKLITSNLRLVVSIAKRYRQSSIPLIDLIQEGNLGLIKAVKMFNPDKGVKLSTYATFWIKEFIVKAIQNKDKLIRIPTTQDEKLNKIRRMQDKLIFEIGREPTNEELAKALNISTEKLEKYLKMKYEYVSLDERVGIGEGDPIIDLIKDGSDSVEENIVNEENNQELHENIDKLNRIERNIIIQRYGLDGNYPKTQKAVGKKYGISNRRVSIIEQDAIKNLKKKM